jgi:hypothetical protein
MTKRGTIIMQSGAWGRGGRVLTLVAAMGFIVSAGRAEGAIPTLRESLKNLAQQILEVVKKD